jgi:hypothetical protein
MPYRIAIVLLTLLAAIAVAVAACSGSDSGGGNEPLDLDPATEANWRAWAAEATALATDTNQRYRTGTLTLENARANLKSAQDLAGQIRASDAADGPILVLAGDLEDLAHGLEFGLEFAANTGISVVNIEVSTLDDAIAALARDADDLSNRLSEDAGD